MPVEGLVCSDRPLRKFPGAARPPGEFSAGVWTAEKAPLPPSAESGLVQLGLPACPVAGWCAVAGNYRNLAGSVEGRLWVLSDDHWTTRTLPNPGNASFDLAEQLSCPEKGWCELLANDTIPGSGQLSYQLIDNLSNGRLTATNVPIPPGISTVSAPVLVSISARRSDVALDSVPTTPPPTLMCRLSHHWNNPAGRRSPHLCQADSSTRYSHRSTVRRCTGVPQSAKVSIPMAMYMVCFLPALKRSGR